MDNPFYRRATEQLRDDEAFLSIVSPQPLTYLLKRPTEQGTLYDRLVIFRGAPVRARRHWLVYLNFRPYGRFFAVLVQLTMRRLPEHLKNAARLKMDFRFCLDAAFRWRRITATFREFPYADGLKSGMLFTFVQARAVLAWFRQLQAAGVPEAAVTVIARTDSGSGLETIGGTSGAAILQRAREVERAVYEIIGALVAPSESSLPPSVTGTYRPFDVIDRIEVTTPSLNQGKPLRLAPLIMLDDAHSLHPSQFGALRHWLARRELRLARLGTYAFRHPSAKRSVVHNRRR